MKGKRILLHLTPKLKKQEMDDVFTEFYRLDEILEKNDQHTQNYVVIRLVTIIEQFFRKIVEKQIKDKKGVIPSEITINTGYLSDMQSTSKERLISSSYSFQNVEDIVQTMKNFQILNVFSCKEENCQDKFKELFKLRHDTVHTVIPLKEDITKYREMTEYVMRHVLVKAHGDDRYFYVSKGNAFLALKRYNDARECYDQLIKTRPDYYVAYVNKGFAIAKLGQHEDAVMCFEKAIELKPDSVETHHNRGLSLAVLGRHEDAVMCFEKAIELKPDFKNPYICQGSSLATLGRHEDVIKCLEEAIKLNPDSVEAHNNKGLSLAALGRHDEAIRCFEKAMDLKPNSTAVYNQGNSFMSLEKYEKAIKYILKRQQSWNMILWKRITTKDLYLQYWNDMARR